MDDWGDAFRFVTVFSGPLIAMTAALWALMKSESAHMRRWADQRFEAVDQRFEAVDQRFEAVDQRFEAFRQDIDQRFEVAETRSLERHEALLQAISQLDANVRYLGEQTAATKERVARIEGRLGMPSPEPQDA